MINYSETKRGDILEVTGQGAPGFVKNGGLVRVKEVKESSVLVEDENGEDCKFVFNCGAERLNTTKWKEDFPETVN